jgi:hypothetical protein
MKSKQATFKAAGRMRTRQSIVRGLQMFFGVARGLAALAVLVLLVAAILLVADAIVGVRL